MSLVPHDSVAVIEEFVRGERSWRNLERAGVKVKQRWNRRFDFLHPSHILVKVDLCDVSRGLLNSFGKNKSDLSQWAIIVLGANFIELSDEFETNPEGDVLLSALWDASFGDSVSEEAIEVARSNLRRVGEQ